MYKEKEKGGLGIKDLDLFNKSLLGKWIWRMLEKGDRLWVRILKSKYGNDPFLVGKFGEGNRIRGGGAGCKPLGWLRDICKLYWGCEREEGAGI